MRAFAANTAFVAALAVMALPGHAGVITAGDVFPLVNTAGDVSSNGLTIGNTATGSLQITGGSTLTDTNSVGVFGLAPGSSGAVTISGAGSTLSIINNGTDQSGLIIGRSGTGSLRITNGGSLTIDAGSIINPRLDLGGSGNVGCPTISCPGGNGTLIVDGAGSTVKANTGFSGGFDVGRNGGTGTAVIENGAIMYTPPAGLTVGRNGSTGTLTVTGVGSQVIISGTDPEEVGISIGLNRGPGSTAPPTGVINVLKGGAIIINPPITQPGAGIGIGQDGGGTGTLNVIGAGSLVSLSGAAYSITIGTARGGTGTVNVLDGGTILVNPSAVSPVVPIAFISVGASNDGLGGSSGALNISGAGSLVSITGARPFTFPDGFVVNPGLFVGRFGSGTVKISGGGVFTLNDSGTTGQGKVTIGGNFDFVAEGALIKGVPPSNGIVTVTGRGSKIVNSFAHGSVDVGAAANGTGSLTVTHGGSVSTERLDVGALTGSVGTLTVSGRRSQLSLSGDDGAGVGAQFVVGRAGSGTATIADRASVDISSTGSLGGVMIGGTGTEAGGNGTMAVTGRSRVAITGTNNRLVVGMNGTGALAVSGRSVVTVARGDGSSGQTFVGLAPGATGAITLTGHSTLNAGSLLGIGSDGVNNTGTGSVILRDASTVNATSVVIGQKGLLGGNGTVNGNVTNNGGVLEVGAAPDPLHINGNVTQTGGSIKIEVAPDGHGGFVTDTLSLAPGKTFKVAGAAIDSIGLVAARWPSLLKTPEKIGQILLQSGQDPAVTGDPAEPVSSASTSVFQPSGALQVPVASGSQLAIQNARVSTSGPVGNMSKLSGALSQAVAVDSFGRDFPINMAAAVAPKSTVGFGPASIASLQANASTVRRFTEFDDGGYLAMAFTGAQGAPDWLGDGWRSPALITDPTSQLKDQWSFGLSRGGTYLGSGQGAGAALSFSEARWGGKTAFQGNDAEMAASLLALTSNASYATGGFDLARGSRLSFGVTTANDDSLAGLGGVSHSRGVALGYTFEPTHSAMWKMSMTGSFLNERNMLLGAVGSGALSLGDNRSVAFGLGSNFELGNGFQLGLDAIYAATNSSRAAASLIAGTTQLTSMGFGMALGKEDLFTDHDLASLTIKKPLRVYGGAAQADISTGVDENGNPMFARQRISLVPTGSETAFGLNYARRLGEFGTAGLTLIARTDADNVAGAKDLGAMLRFRLDF